jgi:hypothetical protein
MAFIALIGRPSTIALSTISPHLSGLPYLLAVEGRLYVCWLSAVGESKVKKEVNLLWVNEQSPVTGHKRSTEYPSRGCGDQKMSPTQESTYLIVTECPQETKRAEKRRVSHQIK